MDANLDACAAFTFREEGGYSSTRLDAGNWSTGRIGVGTLIGSNYGISAPTLIAWNPRVTVTPAYMRTLPAAIPTAILGARFWNTMRCGEMPVGIDLMLSDFGFNTGTTEAAMILQETLGLTGMDVDGSIGPQTVGLACAADPGTLIASLSVAQAAHYRTLANFPTFGTGWLNRTARRAATAVAMRRAAEAMEMQQGE